MKKLLKINISYNNKKSRRRNDNNIANSKNYNRKWHQ